MATAGSIVIDLLLKTGAFETDSKRAEKRLREMQKTAKQFGVAVGGAVLTAGTALAAVTMKAIQFADQMDEMSQKVGISTETLSGWAYAANLSGTSLESIGRVIPRLSKAMADAQVEGSRMSELFKTLGVDTVDPLTGSLRDVEKVLPELADKFKALNNDTLETALAVELFGRSGAEMLKFLNRGSDGIKELTDRAAELGIVIGSETAANAAEFNDRMDDMKALAMALGLQLADRLLPALTDVVEQFSEFIKEGEKIDGLASDMEDAFGGIADGAVALAATVKAVVLDLMALYFAAQGLAQMALFLDDEGAALSFEEAGRLRGEAAELSDQIADTLSGRGGPGGSGSGRKPAGRGGIPMGDGQYELIRPTEAMIAEFLENPTGTKPGGSKGLSDAEKEAQALQRAYEGLVGSLDRQAFMLGKVGEEAQVRYEIEMGALQGLDPALKDQLLTKAALLDAEIKAREEAEKAAELDRQATEAFERMNGSILEQIELIGMSADEQEVYLNLAWAGVEAESERGKIIAENTRRYQEQREAMADQIELMDGLRDVGKGFLEDLREGVGIWDALGNAAERFADVLFKMAAEGLIDQLFGKQGDPGGGQWGDAIGSFFSAFGGSKAGGGDTIAGRGYLIGEQGPEMFVPRSAGTIIPAEQVSRMAGGSTQQTNNITFVLPGRNDMRTEAQRQADLGRATQRQLARSTA